MDHVDRSGQACHSEGTDHYTATDTIWISQPCRQLVREGIIIGKTSDQIITDVQSGILSEIVKQQGIDLQAARNQLLSNSIKPRDWSLSKLDISNIGRKLTEATWRRSPEQAESIRLWTIAHAEQVVFYQQQEMISGDVQPFLLSIMDSWQEEQLLKYGDKGPLCMDATFATNNMKVSNLAQAPNDD